MLQLLLLCVGATPPLPSPPYVHPGIIVSKPMLDQIRADVQAKVQPTYAAYLSANVTRVAKTATYGLWLADPAYKPQCQPLLANGSGWVPFKEDAFAAYTHALLWYIEQDEKHALKAIELLDGWEKSLSAQNTTPFINVWGLQAGWGTAVWPRAAEIIRHAYGKWPEKNAAAFGKMMEEKLLPVVEQGSNSNGNLGLVMAEASFHIGIYNDNATTVNTALGLWRGIAPSYLYVSSDGASPKRPPLQPHMAGTGPVCDPSCTDKQMVDYWHGQKIFGTAEQDGICQESCRDLSHVELGYATLTNTAETAYHQGIDLYGENKERIIAGAEFHVTLYVNEPAAFQQKWPKWLCGGKCSGEHCHPANASTFEMVHHHFSDRLGIAMPNVTALLTGKMTPRPTSCWDHMCWETLTHGGSHKV